MKFLLLIALPSCITVQQATSYPSPQCLNEGKIAQYSDRPWVSYSCDEGFRFQICPDNMTYAKQSGECLACKPQGHCTDGEYRANICNCRVFYHCDNGDFVSKICVNGKGFNNDKNDCDHDYNVLLCRNLGQVKADFA